MCGVLDLEKMDCKNGESLWYLQVNDADITLEADCENGESLWHLQGMLIDEVCLLSGLVSGF